MTTRLAWPDWQGALRHYLFVLLTTLPLILATHAAQTQTIQFGNYHALVIGNDNYKHWKPLQTAVRDAEEVADILESKYGFQVDLLRNAAHNDIIRAINRLRAKLTVSDNLLIYYAGHGHLDGSAGFWIGVDGEKNSEVGWVDVDSRVTRNLKEMTAHHVLVVADSCYSGTLTRDEDEAALRTGQERSLWLKRLADRRARVAMVSGGLEPVADTGREGHSAFAIEFIEALEENAEVLAGWELFSRLSDDVVISARQTPDYGRISFADHAGGDFLFVPRDVQVAALEPPTDTRFGPQRGGADVIVWQAIQGSTNPADFETFLDTYPNSPLVPFAQQRLAMLSGRAAPETPSPAEPVVGVYEKPSQYQPGDEFRDCDDCPLMVVVPAGSFTMGSPPGEARRDSDEGPQHQVTIARPFAVGRFEVTFDEWDACVKSGGCNGYKPSDQGWGRSRRPVINVSWDDAKAYVAWLSKETGQLYGLLSEAEWEYAARAGTMTQYWWGDAITPENANYGANVGKTTEVGAYPPNPWGLYDMLGNVSEWVEDCPHDSYLGAPSDGSAWTSGDCRFRMLRGDAWRGRPESSSADRGWINSVGRWDYVGFRVARTLR